MNKKYNYWTFEKCKEEALKYNTKMDFKINSASSYNKCIKNKWIKDVCLHMEEIKKPKEYWTFDKCKKEALKYNTKMDFNKNSIGAYSKAWENNWLDDICKHMITIGNSYKRCIYAYEFSDNHVYIGLTFNIDIRNQQHMKNGPVANHIEVNKNYKFKMLTDYIDCEEAKINEQKYIDLYKNNNWIILNKSKAGGLGGNKEKWTKDKCKQEALKYTNIKDYSNNSLSYRTAVRNKWLDEICIHMNRIKKSTNFWTKENCKKEFLKYNSKKDFRLKSRGAYSAARKNNWLEEIYS